MKKSIIMPKGKRNKKLEDFLIKIVSRTGLIIHAMAPFMPESIRLQTTAANSLHKYGVESCQKTDTSFRKLPD
ncbi:MAG: hypothetical protein L6246_02240 [Thermodesulfovibrionales bacterium]|nr:hypothetical protein [Thermodesulfovibrionales bacterium]